MIFLKNRWSNFFFFSGAKRYFFLILISLIVAAYLGAKTPKLISDLSFYFTEVEKFNQALFLFFINILFIYFNRVSYQLLSNKYIRLLIQNSRLKVYTLWLKADHVSSDKYPQGEIISRIMSDTDAIRELLTSGAFGIVIDLAFVISCLFGFIKLHFLSGVLLSFSEILATILLFWGSGLMRNMFIKLRTTQARVNRTTANVLGGFHQSYYLENNNYAQKKCSVAFDEFLETQNTVNSMDAFYYAIAESLYPILLAVVVVFFPILKIVETALIFAIIDLIQRSIAPIKEISGKIANVQRARTGIERIVQFIDDIPSNSAMDAPLNNVAHLKNFKANLVRFSYDEKRSEFNLSDISFSGNAGELIGIVGLSGCGKSTLINILSLNLHCDSLCAQLNFNDGIIDISDKANYLHHVSLITQDSHVFSGSLAFNICLQTEIAPSFYELYKSYCEKIPYLKTWGIGPDDKIEPSSLSLGQKQLLAGLRALYLKKSVVFLDEISSALDPILEESLREMILLIQKNSLTVIIAHRIETILRADNIYVMDNGRVKDSGKYNELLARSDIFKKFIDELSHS